MAPGQGLAHGRHGRFFWLLGPGQIDHKGAAHAGLALHADAATGLRHDAVHGGQPQAGALALRFGGEKGLKQV